MKDSVENDVEGLAEKIIAEDEERRAQELVRVYNRPPLQLQPTWLYYRMFLILHRNGQIGT